MTALSSKHNQALKHLVAFKTDKTSFLIFIKQMAYLVKIMSKNGNIFFN